MHMSDWTKGRLFGALKAAGMASVVGCALVLGAGPAWADPDPVPGDPGVVAPPADPPPAPANAAPFGPPRINPANGATVGVGQPIIIDFPGRVDDAGAAEGAIKVS
jgi:hypothetical protein